MADDKRTPEQVEYARVDALLKSGQKPKLWKPVGVQLKGIHEADSAVDIYITTNEIDRDGDLVNQKGMKLPDGERVPLVAAHFYYDLMNHIGAVEGIKAQATRIAARPRYFTSLGNMQADWAYMLVKLGVAAYSIGFIPGEVVWADYNDEKVLARIQAGKLARREFVTWELAETSHVIVPSNRGAVQRLADMGVLTGQAAEDALAKSVETALSPKADLLLTKAFKMFEQTRPTKTVVEINPEKLQAIIDAKTVKEEPKVENEQEDVMALFAPEVPEVKAPEPTPEPVVVPVPEDKATMTIKLSEEDTQAIRDFTQTAIDDAFAEVRGDIEKLYEFLRDAGTEIKGLREEWLGAKAEINKLIEDTRADVEKRLGTIPDDSAAYVTAKELIDAVMAGVREIVDERISVVRGDPDEFLRTKKVRRK